MNLNYDLALELKDAGFPQNFDIGSRGHDGVVTWFAQNQETLVEMREHAVYIPTLSELIEACGEIILWKNGAKWSADIFNGRERDYIDENFDASHGPIPEIAVAKLYIALNKK